MRLRALSDIAQILSTEALLELAVAVAVTDASRPNRDTLRS